MGGCEEPPPAFFPAGQKVNRTPFDGPGTQPGPVFHALRAEFPRAIRGGWQEPPFEVIVTAKDSVLKVARHLRETWGLDALMDLTVVDYDGYQSERKPARFEVVWYLYSFVSHRRIRLKAPVPDTDPMVPTLTGLYASADWLEREAWDMFGIVFKGHPGLRRLLMYEEFSGHPLRKDYPLKGQQPRIGQLHPGVPPFGRRPKVLGGS